MSSPLPMSAKDRVRDLTIELAALDGVTGFEQPVVRRLVELLTPLVDSVAIDAFGNIIATRRGRRERPARHRRFRCRAYPTPRRRRHR